MRKLKISLIVISSLLLFSQVSYAATSKELESKQKEIVKQRDKASKEAKQKKDSAERTQNKVDSVQREIANLDEKISLVTAQIIALEGDIKVLNENISKNQKDLEDAEKNLASKREIFAKRVRAMYMDGKASYIEVLLNSKDMDELIRNNQIITAIAESDKKLIDYVSTQIIIIKNAKKQLEFDKKKLIDKKKKLDLEKKALLISSNKKSEYMKSLEKDVNLYMKEYAEKEAAWKDLDKKILELKSQISNAKAAEKKAAEEKAARERLNKASGSDNFVGSIGKRGLMWPVAGHMQISSPYGYRYHPILKTMRFHSGIDIPAPNGTPVRAVKSGTVIMASKMSGYGNVVMIDHGDIVTVYAHNSAIKVSAGQYVNQGDVISYIGSTGLSTGAHLHFEVRVNGATQNPLNYL